MHQGTGLEFLANKSDWYAINTNPNVLAKEETLMKTRILSVVTITAIFFTSIFIWTRTQSQRRSMQWQNIALMLPDSDIIVAVDMNKTLNIVGPSLDQVRMKRRSEI